MLGGLLQNTSPPKIWNWLFHEIIQHVLDWEGSILQNTPPPENSFKKQPVSNDYICIKTGFMKVFCEMLLKSETSSRVSWNSLFQILGRVFHKMLPPKISVYRSLVIWNRPSYFRDMFWDILGGVSEVFLMTIIGLSLSNWNTGMSRSGYTKSLDWYLHVLHIKYLPMENTPYVLTC